MSAADALLAASYDAAKYPFFAALQQRLRAAREGAGAGDGGSVLDRCIRDLVAGRPLSDGAAREAFEAILGGGLAEDQVGALLALLVPDQLPASTIAAFSRVVIEKATRVRVAADVVGDTCGTGGDARGTFNVSTTIMFVLAAGGVVVAKHGNRAFTSQCGSADVLEALGVKIDLSAPQVERCIERAGVGFLFAPNFHASFRNVQSVRKKLAEEMPDSVKRRTVFNVLGPLSNPAGATCQVVGVFDRGLTAKFADVLKLRGLRRALVPYGEPLAAGDKGFDEISIAGRTTYAELKADGAIESKTLEPEDVGLRRVTDPDTLRGGDRAENARILREVLEGKASRERTDFALINAGAGFYVTGKAPSIAEGVRLAREVLESGKATQKLDALRAVSHEVAST